MAKADRVHSTRRITAFKIPADRARLVARQQRQAEAAAKRVAVLRRKAQAEIERLICFLDQSDEYVTTEREDDNEREREDVEPDLGSLDRQSDQTRWAGGGIDDKELDRADDEPSLGSCDPSMWGGDQTRWAAGGRRDLEQDHAESGIADYEGVLEQVGSGDWTQTVMA